MCAPEETGVSQYQESRIAAERTDGYACEDGGPPLHRHAFATPVPRRIAAGGSRLIFHVDRAIG